MPIGLINESEVVRAPPPPRNVLVEDDDEMLVAEAKGGSATALEQLVERYERKVFRLAQNITHNREDAEEVTQNAFLKAFRNLPGFRGDSRFYTWLVRITVNEALMRVRRRRFSEVPIGNSSETDGDLVIREIRDRSPNPEQRYSQQELQIILAGTINELRPKHRVVFQLREVEGFSTEETAHALALSSSAVKTRLRRARYQMRESLDNHFGIARYL